MTLWFEIGLLTLVVYVIVIHIMASIRLKRLEKRAQRADGDINTLHHNEGVILSSLNELCKEVRKHEKNTRLIKRQIRQIPTSEEGKEDGEREA